ncbi:hypothetical protein HN709_02835 [Candidatus Peregrinibacteria bacterium]|jgi:hypothetical protein|nr:hypothetical protein [Candidatus Peregrinibacteria bacterium]MBT7736600.1 hypothetical protein [Candidatus Peregrinibacteria bacterium]
MDKECSRCSSGFEVTDDDLKFYQKVSPVVDGVRIEIPSPTLCPECRFKDRLCFRNQSTMYRRKCDKTGKDIISMYKEDAPFPVVFHEEWYKDDWDARNYGRDFDFSKSFFEQFLELRNEVPHMSLVFHNNENCDYCNVVGDSKNCYLIYGSIECEDCYYGNPYKCIKCVDSFLLRDSELCLECVDSSKLYGCYRCQNCSNSSDLKFCFEVNNSKDCFCCAALNHKQYCIYNEQYSKEEYERIVGEIDLMDPVQFEKVIAEFEKLKVQVPHKYYVGTNNENVSGNYIFNSKDCHDVYGVDECRDVSHSFQLQGVNDSMDLTVGEYGELNYNVSAFYGGVSRVVFSYFCWGNVHDLVYCGQCTQNVADCFGCVGMSNAQYCILNKQYSKGEYEDMVKKIIELMKERGEWGEFFPSELSPFDYNETVAAEFFPKGNDELLDAPFKIIPQEEKMYKRFRVPLPVKSPKRRHLDRIALRNKMNLNEVDCYKCGDKLLSTYSLDQGVNVYCGKCYLESIYG